MYSFVLPMKATNWISSTELGFIGSFGLSAGQNTADCVRSAAPVCCPWDLFLSKPWDHTALQVFVVIFYWGRESVPPQLLRKYKVLSFPTVPACIRVESRETLWMDGGSTTQQTCRQIQAWLWVGTECVQFTCAACETHFMCGLKKQNT